MAMVACDECGKQISDKAAACPQCGAKPARKYPPLRSIAGAIIVLGFVLTVAVGLGSENIPILGPIMVGGGLILLIVSWFIPAR